MKQKFMELKEEIDKSIIIVRNFPSLLSTLDGTTPWHTYKCIHTHTQPVTGMQILAKSKCRIEEMKEILLALGVLIMCKQWPPMAWREVRELKKFSHLTYRYVSSVKEWRQCRRPEENPPGTHIQKECIEPAIKSFDDYAELNLTKARI